MNGSLQIKNGKYYAVLSIKDSDGNFKKKWVSTGYEIRGNKKKAQEVLNTLLMEHETHQDIIENNCEPTLQEEKKDLLLEKYLEDWFVSIKNSVEEITYANYERLIKTIINYFGNKNIYLKEFAPGQLQEFYNTFYKKGTLPNTVLHYHMVIRKALQDALKLGLVDRNIADIVGRPKKVRYQAQFYNKKELEKLFEVIFDDPLEVVIKITAYYGLRRSEVLGLKWSAIDFENKVININHKVVNVGTEIIAKDKMKTKTSNRTLPLVPYIEDLLKLERWKQKVHKRFWGNAYCQKYLDYICVDKRGELIMPYFVTNHFSDILKKNNLKHIRFHDLRHSCASLMLANGVPMKNIQEWLGHSSFNVTADLYTHLDYSSKIDSANTISKALNFSKDNEQVEHEDDENEL